MLYISIYNNSVHHYNIIVNIELRYSTKELLKNFSDFYCIAGNNCYLCQSMKNNLVILHHHHPIS